MTTNERALSEKARKLISGLKLFQGLVEQQRAHLFGRIRLRKFSAGETIFLKGDLGASLMAVVEGSIQVSVPSPDGKEIVLAMLHPGEVLGEIGLLDGRDRSADARALTACTIAFLERRDVLRAFEQCPQAYFDVVQLLCERIRRTTMQMAEVTLLNLPSRLARTLLRAADASSADEDTRLDRVKLSQRDLGNMVGATRESVNKCLGNWRRNRIVEIESSGIRILDRRALESLANLMDF